MINVLNMTKTGVVDDLSEFKFDFEFDNASTLPVNFVVMEQKKYLIAEGSTAKNVCTNTYYTYNGVGKKWVKTLSKTPMPAPTTDTNITENGNYSVVNNDTTGYNDVTVNVFSEPAVLINKDITINGNYNASSDNVNGYSAVNVNVPNTYTNEDEGKVVDNGALVAQTAMTEEITENGVVDTTLYDSVTVNVSGSGGSSGNDVIFYDYDGSVVTSYSAADFANLSAMPANPTHEGLTAQGWNWSLADAKAYVASYGKLNMGQMYITSDGKTRLYCAIPKNGLALDLYLTLDEDTELDIDWGDGTEHTIWTDDEGATIKGHQYSDGGNYIVAITVVRGGFTPDDCDGRYGNTFRRVEFGSGLTDLGAGAFRDCSSLTSITIPNSVTIITQEFFNNCYALKSITIPNSVTSIEDNAFQNCYALSSVTFPNTVTSIGINAFDYCYPLSSITIPNSVTSIGINAFDNCHALSSVTIPDGVTSIDEYAFYYCYSLSSITIPDTVTSIGGYIFSDCYGLSSVTFESPTPPELGGDLGLPTTCIIRVPQGTLSDYTLASNYPDPSVYIYEEY